MNQYIKIPRGINVISVNDIILKNAIEKIGKHYNKDIPGKNRSNYAKGKAYLSKKYGLSKSAIKKLHSVKDSVRGHNNYGDNYSNFVNVHIELATDILNSIIISCKGQEITFAKTANSISGGKYDFRSKYIEALFEETIHWIEQSFMDGDNFCKFNRNGDAITVLRCLYNSLNSIDERIREC